MNKFPVKLDYMIPHVQRNPRVSGCLCVFGQNWLNWLFTEGEVTRLLCSAPRGSSRKTPSSRWTLVFISTSALSHWGTWSDHAVCLPYALRQGLKDPFPLVHEIPPRNPSTPLIPWRSTLSLFGWGHTETQGETWLFLLKKPSGGCTTFGSTPLWYFMLPGQQHGHMTQA